jgi:DNA-binding response OmpR family regulator
VRLRRLTSPSCGSVRLTNTEFNVLVAFLAAPQRVLSRDQLLGLSRMHNDEVYDRAIDTQVGRLRRKLEPPGSKAHSSSTRSADRDISSAPKLKSSARDPFTS